MAIDRPEAIGAASGTDRSEAEDAVRRTLLFREECARAQGKKVRRAALRPRRSRRSRLPARSSRKRTHWSACAMTGHGRRMACRRPFQGERRRAMVRSRSVVAAGQVEQAPRPKPRARGGRGSPRCCVRRGRPLHRAPSLNETRTITAEAAGIIVDNPAAKIEREPVRRGRPPRCCLALNRWGCSRRAMDRASRPRLRAGRCQRVKLSLQPRTSAREWYEAQPFEATDKIQGRRNGAKLGGPRKEVSRGRRHPSWSWRCAAEKR